MKKNLLEAAIGKIVAETLKEAPMMIDMGTEAQRQALVKDAIDLLSDAEDMRAEIMALLKTETDPAEKAMLQSAALKFQEVIKGQYETLRDLAKGTTKLHGRHMPEGVLPEGEMYESAPPGMEDVVLALKKKYGEDSPRPFQIAWAQYNKKHGK